ncbi:PEP-CTERM sorting domain-containing protein [Pseudomonas aeruginosa]|nr:PEP-CTERM sorting domain-containing protein [Pseudomonas aeruginosa]EKF8202482.1 PEP-CTERM sorting domain-containing protein [Pseudomonas aeruginosa]EKI0124033.1 PEP-CTERM sorting domain-containing protein [Pseudomonas aeruginosa]EKY1861058.1 PEP-CTERM sorting domain-containing protein [Pseudomonas aeruginosa]ELK4834954.1 PEP-CTERM sorting domain-containing protein [Pseudomonas aeruginosa]
MTRTATPEPSHVLGFGAGGLVPFGLSQGG